MLPNWLFTQALVEHELSWVTAEHTDPSGQVAPQVVAALRASALRTAVLPARLGGLDGQWEQVGRGLSALGSICPATAWLAHEHASVLYRLARTTGPGPVLSDVVDNAALLVGRGAEAVEIQDPVVARWPRVEAPAVRVIATLGEPAADPPPALSTAGYVIRAALASAVINGVATDLLRRIARADIAPGHMVGAAVTALLTAQASAFRGLSMVDALAAADKESDGGISAAFHTSVRGGVQALMASLEAVFDQVQDLNDQPYGWLVGVLRAMARHPVLGDDSWNDRVYASLAGDWTHFEDSVVPA